ncbi:MAG: hypothetical protein WEG40_13835 [Candidatus Rokuibacteriota bacterium]
MYIGVEIVEDSIGRERDNAMMHRIRWNALEEGLLIAGSKRLGLTALHSMQSLLLRSA